MFKYSKRFFRFMNKKEHYRKFVEFYGEIASKYDWIYFFTLGRHLKFQLSPLEDVKGEVLELGFGNGKLLIELAKKYKVTGLDYSQNMLTVARRRLLKKGLRAKLVLGNMEKLPFKAKSFDTVVATFSFNGVVDHDKCMKEVVRVLKPKGKLIIVDVCKPKKKSRFGNYVYRKSLDFGDIIRDEAKLMRKYGFKVKEKVLGFGGAVHKVVGDL